MLEYKMQELGKYFIKAYKWFPSSKLCSDCGRKKETLTLSERIYKCECGLELDRDINAALNLKHYAINKLMAT